MNSSKVVFGKRTRLLYGFFLLISDIIWISFSFFIAYYLRFYTGLFSRSPFSGDINPRYLIYSIIMLGIIVLASAILRLYDAEYIYRSLGHYARLVISAIISFVSIYYLARPISNLYFSRIWIAISFILILLLMILSRYILGLLLKKTIRKNVKITVDIAFTVLDNMRMFKNLGRFRKKLFYGFFLVASDIIFLIFAFYLSYYLRFNTGALAETNTIYQIEINYILYSIIFILSAVLVFYFFRLYNWDYIYRGSGYYSRIIKGILINIVIIILAGYLFELFTFSRKWIFLLLALSIFFIILSRFIWEILSIRFIRKLDVRSRTIIIGIGENSKRIEDSFKKYSFEREKVLGYADSEKRIKKSERISGDFKILGYLEDIKEVIQKYRIQRVIISSPEYKYFEILEILEKIKGLDLSILVFPGFFEFSIKRVNMREIAGIPLMQVSNIGFFGFNLFLKTSLDYVLGLIIFIFFIPIYLVVGFMIKIDSRGPVFYKQKRLTKDGKAFYMYKFRSMHIDADKRLKELKKYNEADGPLFKIKNDPRITRVGKYIRRLSIDELPQIINVLKGELSLVGPRPPLPEEVKKYSKWEARRMDVKQGITGMWQVSGRSELSFEEMAKLDLYYIQNWSIELDIKIILKTIPAAIFGKGAY